MTVPGSRNEFGEFVPGAATSVRVWLTRIDAPADRDPTLAGDRVVTRGRFRVRWFQQLADFDVSLGADLLFDAREWRINSIDEVDDVDVRTDRERSAADASALARADGE